MGKNPYPGSGINIPDPQYCCRHPSVSSQVPFASSFLPPEVIPSASFPCLPLSLSRETPSTTPLLGSLRRSRLNLRRLLHFLKLLSVASELFPPPFSLVPPPPQHPNFPLFSSSVSFLFFSFVSPCIFVNIFLPLIFSCVAQKSSQATQCSSLYLFLPYCRLSFCSVT
jgi:hypothetical protein